MSALFSRLKQQFDIGARAGVPGVEDDTRFAPAIIRPAAVLIAVTEREEPGVLLIHRPHNMRQHADQVAFPGGKVDPGEDAVQAALREAHEELAVEPGGVRIIGAAGNYITGSGFAITPVLGTISPDLPLCPNPAEVSDWFEAPLAHVLNPSNHVQRERHFNGHLRRYIEIEWQGRRIWGITAGIIANLSRQLAWEEYRDAR